MREASYGWRARFAGGRGTVQSAGASHARVPRKQEASCRFLIPFRKLSSLKRGRGYYCVCTTRADMPELTRERLATSQFRHWRALEEITALWDRKFALTEREDLLTVWTASVVFGPWLAYWWTFKFAFLRWRSHQNVQPPSSRFLIHFQR